MGAEEELMSIDWIECLSLPLFTPFSCHAEQSEWSSMMINCYHGDRQMPFAYQSPPILALSIYHRDPLIL